MTFGSSSIDRVAGVVFAGSTLALIALGGLAAFSLLVGCSPTVDFDQIEKARGQIMRDLDDVRREERPPGRIAPGRELCQRAGKDPC